PGGVARGPTEGPQGIAVEIEFSAVGSLPGIVGQFGLPHLPDETKPRLNDNRVTVTADTEKILLPFLQGISGVSGPGFNWHVGRNGISAGIRSITVKNEVDRDEGLQIRNEDEVYSI